MGREPFFQRRFECNRKPAAGRKLLFFPALLFVLVVILSQQAHAADPTLDPLAAIPDAPASSAETQSASSPAPVAQAESAPPPAALAPQAKQKTANPLDSCQVQNTGATVINTGAVRALAVSGLGAAPKAAGEEAVTTEVCADHVPFINWYARFTTGPDVKPMTVGEKARLAVVNIADPFNLLTIFGEAAISVAANSHNIYGPGIPGWAKNSGVSFTQDMTGQFFGTFLIPSITHTDPHYHRRPDFSIPRRIWHCVYQIAWQHADNGKQAPNYSQIFTPIVGIALSNLYVPGQQTHFAADAERYGVDLATAPIDNFITEFVPSIAARIHTHVIFVQRIINQVARTSPGT